MRFLPKFPRPGSRLTRRLLFAALAVMVLFAALSFLARSEPFLRRALELAVRRGYLPAEVEGFEGSLAGGEFYLRRFAWENDDVLVELENISLAWLPSPFFLLNRAIHVNRFHAGRVIVTLKAESSVPEFPEINLPAAAVNVWDGRVDRLEVKRGAARYEAGDIGFSFQAGRRGFLVRLARARTANAEIDGWLRMAASRPHAVSGKVNARVTVLGVPCRARAVIGGSLARLEAGVDGRSAMGDFRLDGVFNPWETAPIDSLRVRVSGFDPSRRAAQYPSADLEFLLEGRSVGRAKFAGRLEAVNHDPGRLDRRRLPLRSLSLRFAGDLERLSVSALAADLGPGGRAAGSGRWARESARLDLVLADLAPEEFHRTLARLEPEFSGRLAIEWSPGRLQAAGTLENDRLAAAFNLKQAGGRLELAGLDLASGDARAWLTGALALSGSFRFDAAGRFSELDPARFGAWPAARLAGDFRVAGSLRPQWRATVDFSLGESAWRTHVFTARGGLALSARGARDIKAEIFSGANRAGISGSAENGVLAAEWDAEVTEPALLYPGLTGRLRGRGTLSGDWDKPKLTWEAFGRGLDFQGRFRADEARAAGTVFRDRDGSWRLEADEAGASLGRNTLRAQGGFGRASVAASWSLDLPEPALLYPGLAGRLRGRGTLAGQTAFPRLKLNLSGENLAFRDQFSVGVLRGEGELGREPDGDVKADLALERVFFRGTDLGNLTMALAGTGRRHQVELRGRGTRAEFALDLAGGLDGEGGWSGRAERLLFLGAERVSAETPFHLALNRRGVTVREARLASSAGAYRIDRLEYGPDGLETAGQATKVPFALAGRLGLKPSLPASVRSDLVFDLRWDVSARPELNGTVFFRRESGDLFLAEPPQLALGLDTAEVSLVFRDNRASVEATLNSARAGEASLRGAATLVRRGAAWGFSGDAPLELSVRARTASLDWLPYPELEKYQLAGEITADFSAAGTFRHPVFHGFLQGNNLQARLEEHGFVLRNGMVSARFEDDKLLIENLVFDGARGRLVARGYWRPGAEAEAQLDFEAAGLEAVSRPDRWLIFSGQGQLALNAGRVALTGFFQVDSGRLIVPAWSRLALSPDIRIVGRPQGEPARPKTVLPAVDLDVVVESGGDLSLSINGLETKLQGSVTVVSGPGRPLSVNGDVNLVKGTYTAYGQRLVIDRGVISFHGPPENPVLDVIALRRNQPVEAGVRVTGLVRSPEVTLVSFPEVADIDKLAWLVIGRPSESAERADVGFMIAAADTLLSDADAVGIQTQIAQVFGLEEIGFFPEEDMADSVIRLGKRLSDNLYVSYERSVAGLVNLVKIRYNLPRYWSFQAVAGSDQEIGIYYTITFD